jgi:hypothetical protein
MLIVIKTHGSNLLIISFCFYCSLVNIISFYRSQSDNSKRLPLCHYSFSEWCPSGYYFKRFNLMYAELIGWNGTCQKCPPRCKTCEQHQSPDMGAVCLECNGCNYFGFCTHCDQTLFISLLVLFITYVAYKIRYGAKNKTDDKNQTEEDHDENFVNYFFAYPMLFCSAIVLLFCGCQLFQTYI